MPSRLHGSSILPTCCLSSAWVTYSGWMSLPCLCAGCWGDTHHRESVGGPLLRSPVGWGSLPGRMGSCWGKSTWGLHKTGMFGESTKGGEREGLGEERAWKTRGKGYKRGWSHVNKWQVSAHVWPGCKCCLSLGRYCIADLS